MNTVAKYINPDEALMRMTGFVQQPDFQMLTQTKQEDIAAFLVEMEQKDMQLEKLMTQRVHISYI